MPKIALLFSVLLIGLGLVGYLVIGPESSKPASDSTATYTDPVESSSGKRSVTALIPAFVGILLGICGAIGLNDNLRKHAMHAAAVVGLLGALAGLGRGGMSLAKLLAGDATVNQRSLIFVLLMAALCVVFVGLCIQSFRNARKKREESSATEPTSKPGDS